MQQVAFTTGNFRMGDYKISFIASNLRCLTMVGFSLQLHILHISYTQIKIFDIVKSTIFVITKKHILKNSNEDPCISKLNFY
jgi:hypothetical protein